MYAKVVDKTVYLQKDLCSRLFSLDRLLKAERICVKKAARDKDLLAKRLKTYNSTECQVQVRDTALREACEGLNAATTDFDNLCCNVMNVVKKLLSLERMWRCKARCVRRISHSWTQC